MRIEEISRPPLPSKPRILDNTFRRLLHSPPHWKNTQREKEKTYSTGVKRSQNDPRIKGPTNNLGLFIALSIARFQNCLPNEPIDEQIDRHGQSLLLALAHSILRGPLLNLVTPAAASLTALASKLSAMTVTVILSGASRGISMYHSTKLQGIFEEKTSMAAFQVTTDFKTTKQTLYAHIRNSKRHLGRRNNRM